MRTSKNTTSSSSPGFGPDRSRPGPRAADSIPRHRGCRSRKTPTAAPDGWGCCGQHFALWPLAQAAESCFGSDQWSDDVPVPQACWQLNFVVEDIEEATVELKSRTICGCETKGALGPGCHAAPGRKACWSASRTRPRCAGLSSPWSSSLQGSDSRTALPCSRSAGTRHDRARSARCCLFAGACRPTHPHVAGFVAGKRVAHVVETVNEGQVALRHDVQVAHLVGHGTANRAGFSPGPAFRAGPAYPQGGVRSKETMSGV